jgi:hypothetical protein
MTPTLHQPTARRLLVGNYLSRGKLRKLTCAAGLQMPTIAVNELAGAAEINTRKALGSKM